MKKIDKIWFLENRIFMKTEQGEIFSRPLEAFPLLKNATEKERLAFKIGKFKDDVRWENINEGIHIDSFFEKVEPKTNPIGDFFRHIRKLTFRPLLNKLESTKAFWQNTYTG